MYSIKNPLDQRDPLPVLVWFYGGAFMEGNSSVTAYGPEFLLDEDVVVVTLNYRIGLFGKYLFIFLEDMLSVCYIPIIW